MTYPQAIKYLESFVNYEKVAAYPYKESLKLERFRGFLCGSGNPQDKIQHIHVAGSKGKGSTCAFIAYILRSAGFSVGLYTSPHLADFRERIRVLWPSASSRVSCADFEGMISRKEMAGLVDRLRPAIDKFNKNSKFGPLTLFEAYTALAFLYFKEKKVDFAVLETGLGGRLDATNVVNPLACSITPISYEHTDKLGKTLKKIAQEKAGIIKTPSSGPRAPDLMVISAAQKKVVQAVIRDKCRKEGARLYLVGKDIAFWHTRQGLKIRGIFGDEYGGLRIKLLGRHQIENAALAVGAIDALRPYGVKIRAKDIRQGISQTRWPGRCEVIARNPWVLLDGAQNIASAQRLKAAVRGNFKYRRLILVLGISQDKDIKGICRELASLADRVILTRADNPRAAEPGILADYFSATPAYISANVKEARKLAGSLAKKEDLILVTGSLFLVGEYRNGRS
jgi:dihydrofolate synthase/folylpolyglutamate synthase